MKILLKITFYGKGKFSFSNTYFSIPLQISDSIQNQCSTLHGLQHLLPQETQEDQYDVCLRPSDRS